MSRSLLFDLDGTLVDTDHLHHGVFAELLATQGVDLSMDEYKRTIMGRPNSEIMEHWFPGREAEHDRIADEKEATFRDRLGCGADPLPGLTDLLDWADRNAVPVAVVTNAPRENAEAMLSAIRMRDRFPVIVIGPECARPKPDPLPYLTAMDLLGARPENSIAFEDSPSGLRAAAGSGAYAFGMRTGLDDHTLRLAGARSTLKDFKDPVLWRMLEGDFMAAT